MSKYLWFLVSVKRPETISQETNLACLLHPVRKRRSRIKHVLQINQPVKNIRQFCVWYLKWLTRIIGFCTTDILRCCKYYLAIFHRATKTTMGGQDRFDIGLMSTVLFLLLFNDIYTRKPFCTFKQWSIKFGYLSLNFKLQISMTPRLDRWTSKKPIIYYAIT